MNKANLIIEEVNKVIIGKEKVIRLSPTVSAKYGTDVRLAWQSAAIQSRFRLMDRLCCLGASIDLKETVGGGHGS